MGGHDSYVAIWDAYLQESAEETNIGRTLYDKDCCGEEQRLKIVA